MTTIRPGAAEDAHALAEFGARTFRETFGAQNTPENMALYLASTYGPRLQAAELTDARVATLIAEGEGGLAGYAQLREGPAPGCVEGSRPIEIWRFYVDRVWQGRGIAQALMDSVVQAALTRGAGTLWLCVWERNDRAQAFYRKCGFVDRGAKQFRLGNDRQMDRVMVRPLGGGIPSRGVD
jgi:ribosomal protein S18 acetylase RimI-like enzyme